MKNYVNQAKTPNYSQINRGNSSHLALQHALYAQLALMIKYVFFFLPLKTAGTPQLGGKCFLNPGVCGGVVALLNSCIISLGTLH